MKTIVFTGISGATVTYPGDVLAMFSPQPFRASLPDDGTLVVSVQNENSGAMVQETRRTYNLKAEIDVSGMLRAVCDIEEVLPRRDYTQDARSLAERVAISLRFVSMQGETYHAPTQHLSAIYAALDWGESWSTRRIPLRLWINYPQTIAVGGAMDASSYSVNISRTSTSITREQGDRGRSGVLADFSVYQNTLVDYPETLQALLRGAFVTASTPWSIKAGETQTANAELTYTPKIQTEPYGKGIYLRWIQRDGTVGYWLFTQSKETAVTKSRSSFVAHLDGIQAAPVSGVIRNAARQDFSLSESITVGVSNLSEEEYQYLLGLAVSPCIEMLLPELHTGTSHVWARVNVGAVTSERAIPRSGLQRTREFEIVITTPERNTLTL